MRSKSGSRAPSTPAPPACSKLRFKELLEASWSRSRSRSRSRSLALSWSWARLRGQPCRRKALLLTQRQQRGRKRWAWSPWACAATRARPTTPPSSWPRYESAEGLHLYQYRHIPTERWMFSYEFEPDFKAGELLGSEGPASILAAAGPVPIGDHIWHRRGKDIAICGQANCPGMNCTKCSPKFDGEMARGCTCAWCGK